MDKIKPYFPILTWAPAYQKDYIVRDLIAGFTVALTVVPQVRDQAVNLQIFARTDKVQTNRKITVMIFHGILYNFQGLAYASLARLPTEYGLYTSYLSAIIYTFLGSSKDLAVGPQSLMSLLTAEYCMRPQNWQPLEGARNWVIAYFLGQRSVCT